MLRRENITFFFADSAGKFLYAEDLFTDFLYIRLRGAEQLYVSGYDDPALDWWAERIKLWRKRKHPRDARLISDRKIDHQARDVFVYFDNDAKGRAPFDAIWLTNRLAAEC
jgi:uncharacterized protein YecE (DUF72 family)